MDNHGIFNRKKYSPFEILNDAKLEPFLKNSLKGVFTELEVQEKDQNILIDFIWCKKSKTSILDFERSLQKKVNEFISKNIFRRFLDKRAHLIADQISQYIIGNRLADIGCGDGLIGNCFRERMQEIFLVDVCSYLDSRVKLPIHTYAEGEELPIKEQVDTSLLLTVIHHSAYPEKLIWETKRITKKRILIIESVYGEYDDVIDSEWNQLNEEIQFKYATFIDWFYNRIIHDNVPVPYNFASPKQWMKLIEGNNWKITNFIKLGFDHKIVPEFHVLFVVDRIA